MPRVTPALRQVHTVSHQLGKSAGKDLDGQGSAPAGLSILAKPSEDRPGELGLGLGASRGFRKGWHPG